MSEVTCFILRELIIKSDNAQSAPVSLLRKFFSSCLGENKRRQKVSRVKHFSILRHAVRLMPPAIKTTRCSFSSCVSLFCVTLFSLDMMCHSHTFSSHLFALQRYNSINAQLASKLGSICPFCYPAIRWCRITDSNIRFRVILSKLCYKINVICKNVNLH